MSTEAHKLIGISLSKIAQSRASRSGVSLHKNLLVATVLHKARYIFMEEAYQIVHGNNKGFNSADFKFNNPNTNLDQVDQSNVHLESTPKEPMEDELITNDEKLLNDIDDDEWHNEEAHPSTHKNPPTSYQAHIELTYLNLDKYNNTTGTKPEVSTENNNNSNSLKRRHSEWEVEEAVLSILPKRSKSYSALDVANVSSPPFEETSNDHDFTFLDDSDFLSDPNNAGNNPTTKTNNENEEKLVGPSMEIDRLSSLVSIFSFANLSEVSGICEDNDSVQKSITPDQCSAQAKDNSDVLQPVPSFLAMTV